MKWNSIILEVLFYVFFIGLFLLSVRRKGELGGDFSKGTTQCLKGLCCLAIFGHHYGQLSKEPALILFTHFGYLVLNIFLMISGYGVTYGLINKKNYLKNLLVRRCGMVVLCYWGMNGLVVIMNYILYGESKIQSVGQAIKIVSGDTFYCVTSWYFVMLFWLYFSFYLVARFSSKHFQWKMFVIVSVFILWGIITDMPLWYYNYLYAFNVGIYMGFRTELQANKATIPKLICSIGAFLILFAIGKVDRIVPVSMVLQPVLSVCSVLSSMALTMAFMFILDRISVESKLLFKLGSISTGVYVFHTCVILNPLIQSQMLEYTESWGISLWISLLLTIAVSVLAKYILNITKKLLSWKSIKRQNERNYV